MNNDKLTPEEKARWETLAAMPDDRIDTSDIPEIVNWSARQKRGIFHLPPDERREAMSELRRTHPAVADTSERGLENYIVAVMTGIYGSPPPEDWIREHPAAYGADWLAGEPDDYDSERCVDLAQLTAFIKATQPQVAAALSLDSDTPTRRQFLERLSSETSRRGIIEVLRGGVNHLQHNITLFYPSPSANNETAAYMHKQNRFSVTRQLRYGSGNRKLALDIALFVNGLPIATMELKNNLTGQTYKHAIEQYRNDRSRREPLFRPGRCAAHFALDESQVHFCAELNGKQSVFLPFNKGKDGGAGNPVNPDGLRTAYFWQEILNPESLTDIIENYAYFFDENGGRGRKRAKKAIWPRYHQLDVVRKLLADAREKGVGQKYLIQHSAGSGKSNSIAWLARRLMSLETDGKRLFDSIIVITDRRILDRQIDNTIKQFVQVRSNVEHADSSAHLSRLLNEGKRIITTTVQKFPFVQDEIGGRHRDRRFAIIIDEAHSGQGGNTAIEMGRVLGNAEFADKIEDYEDAINAAMESRQLLSNASYFAFTATPKNKTLELFGEPEAQPDGTAKRRPFHIYTMKQAIEEGFILDVLTNYTPYKSYYELNKAVEDDPEFDSRRAQRKLRRYVEEHPHTIEQKAAIMLDHFENAVWRPKKIDGQARAMVVAESVNRALEYYHVIRERIRQLGYQYGVVVAFSGEREFKGATVSEPSLNGFSERETAAKFREGDCRILVCADKFQTGYDEPLLHTMYVDKTLSSVKAVQTLSRLNRVMPGKRETFVLDFANDTDVIRESFADYYRATVLSGETDPNKLHDIKRSLDESEVYTQERVSDVSGAFYMHGSQQPSGRRGDFDPMLDDCVERYIAMSEDEQVEFKGGAKAFTRTYAFLSQIMEIRSKEWEELATFLTFLIPKLPSPIEDDLSAGVEQAVDLDSYYIEKREAMQIILEDADAEIDPVPVGTGGGIAEPDTDPLSVIIAEFNRVYRPPGMDAEIAANIIRAIPSRVRDDRSFQNARKSADMENAKVEHSRAVGDVVSEMLECSAEMYKLYHENAELREWINSSLFRLNY